MSNTYSRIWTRTDMVLAGVAFALSMALYLWSMTPSVGLLDSGEFIVAAQHFGVPHPTGYPLWTLLVWLFLLVPIGNVAWQAALFSGVCGALTIAVCAATLSSMQRWYLGDKARPETRRFTAVIALTFSMMLALSESMWSQAVIVEVYTLHSLLTGLFLALCYSWLRNGMKPSTMLAAVFTLSLSVSNHHLAMVLAPLPFFLVLFLRREELPDWIAGAILAVALVYAGFATISENPAIEKTSARFLWCVGLAAVIFLCVRRGRVRWTLVTLTPVAIIAGLLPYAYMPFASSTNPPMNWSYTRESKGFYDSINRSQYSGTLSDQSLQTLGRAMGVAKEHPAGALPFSQITTRSAPAYTSLQQSLLWMEFFGKQQMIRAFTWVGIAGYLASIFLVLRHPVRERTWLYFLHAAFAAAAFIQPAMSQAGINRDTWWLQMPYHTYTNYIFALIAGIGACLAIARVTDKRPALARLTPALLVLPCVVFAENEASSNQRGRLFGWMFGYDMLKDLPRGAVVIGGTDPGRFIPTYMIFGESVQPERNKIVPGFDRRDLYIITQNALGDPSYRKYLKDQYTDARPAPRGGLERWLGRDTIYPDVRLSFPSEDEMRLRVAEVVAKGEMDGEPMDPSGMLIHSTILKMIWERNKETHDFYVEESDPMKWTYDYATPHGLIYRLNNNKLDTIPADVVARDFAFWNDYKTRLLTHPSYLKDLDAMRSFSKLRSTTANIYRHRGMKAEAERASLEAIELWPGNIGEIAVLSQSLWERGDFDAIIRYLDRALEQDPNNLEGWKMRFTAERRRDAEPEIQALRERFARHPHSRDVLLRLIETYGDAGDTKKADESIAIALQRFPADVDMLNRLIAYYTEAQTLIKATDIARLLTQAEPYNIDHRVLLLKALYYNRKQTDFYSELKEAVSTNGAKMRGRLRNDAFFNHFMDDKKYRSIVDPVIEPNTEERSVE